VSRYAGVLAFHGDQLVLVREEYPTWGGAFWNVPSGRVEDGESPAEGAARELAEETGLVVDPADLAVVSTVASTGGPEESRAWNYTVDVVSSTIAVLDPDGLVLEARWFSRDEAARLLAELPYRPLSEPAVAFLRGEAPIGREWTYSG
jgi:8-oxo-dGTP diphosphatase